jgi:hypothetical protein
MSAKRHSLTLKEKVEIVNVYNNEKKESHAKIMGTLLQMTIF